MQPKTTVKGNRIVIDSRAYDARVLGGGRFDVFTTAGVRVGSFSVRGRAVEADDLGVDGADPVAEIGQLWVNANLSPAAVPKPPPPPEPVVEKPEPAPAAPPEPTLPTAIPAARPSDTSVQNQKDVTWPICRIATYARPDATAFKKAIAYEVWLRTQPGVRSSFLTHDTANGKTVSVTIWETREQLAAMRYAKPPADAVQLTPVSVEHLWVVG